jgi:predicted unusual protein kinase regulating ubiquinone biosynthesis (AarF/ABC1/UbiB family)
MAGRATVGVGRRLLGESADTVDADLRERAAAQMFRVLGELKGGAMKFGQALSLFEAVLPDDVAGPFRQHLVRLQDSAPPMPVSRVEAVMADEFGSSWRDLFTSFGRRPAAAASIGQVHKAVWAETGAPVAVKIQYPGADAALSSDLAQISRLSSLVAPLAGGVDVKALTAELSARVLEEVDYLNEAQNQQQAAEAFADDQLLAVPRVLTATRRVLVTEWLDGRPLREAAALADAERNRMGLAYVTALFAGPSRAGVLHGDPHPGNFLMLADGRLGVIDWGLAAKLPDGLPYDMGHLIRVALDGDADRVTAGLRDLGFVTRDVRAEALLDYLAPFVEPARHDEFHFTRDWMRDQYIRIGQDSRSSDSVALTLNVPPVYALIHRVWLGGIAVLSQLDVRARFADILSAYLPGFADTGDTPQPSR